VVTLSLITDAFIPRTEALALLEKALGTPVSGSNLAQSHFVLDHQTTLSIEIPKFGEDLPLTLDISGVDSNRLRDWAHKVATSLHNSLGWSCQLHEWETNHD
jgi:hypothetical protein